MTAFLFRLTLVAALVIPSGGVLAQDARNGKRLERDIVFATHGARNLALDLYLPEHDSGKLPVVVWIYGGAWMTRNKASQATRAAWLAESGYAVAIIDYRLSSEALFPAQIQDCKSAVIWLRDNADNYDLDGERIGVWGESSGGHLATLLGLTRGVSQLEPEGSGERQSSGVRAVVDFFGPTDFLQMDANAVPNAPFKHDDENSPESRLVGGPIQKKTAETGRANPVTYVHEEAPPFFIVHGEQDPLVPCHQSELLFQALQKVEADVTFYKIAGAGHGGPAFESAEIRAAVRAFFDQHLKN